MRLPKNRCCVWFPEYTTPENHQKKEGNPRVPRAPTARENPWTQNRPNSRKAPKDLTPKATNLTGNPVKLRKKKGKKPGQNFPKSPKGKKKAHQKGKKRFLERKKGKKIPKKGEEKSPLN